MLEHIPIITKEDIESLAEHELSKAESQYADILRGLDTSNPNLAKAIKAIAQTTAKKTYVDDYWRQKVEAKFIVVMLAAVGIINQAFEADANKSNVAS